MFVHVVGKQKLHIANCVSPTDSSKNKRLYLMQNDFLKKRTYQDIVPSKKDANDFIYFCPTLTSISTGTEVDKCHQRLLRFDQDNIVTFWAKDKQQIAESFIYFLIRSLRSWSQAQLSC